MTTQNLLAVIAAMALSTVAFARTPLPPEVVTDKMSIGAGTFLITLERQEDCSVHELNLEQQLRYEDNNPVAEKTVSISIAGYVGSNLTRPAVCRLGKSHGKILVQGPARLQAMSTPVYEPLKIAAVEKVVAKSPKTAIDSSNATLAPGQYIMTLEAPGSCYNSALNINKKYHYGIHGDARSQILNRGRPIGDNLMRPMACYRFAIDTATVLVEVGPYRELVEAEDHMTIVAVEKITKTVAVKSKPDVQSISCRIPDLYDAGYNLTFKKVDGKVKAASLSQISILGGEKIEDIKRCRNFGRRGFLKALCRGRKATVYLDRAEQTAWVNLRGARGYTKLSCQAR